MVKLITKKSSSEAQHRAEKFIRCNLYKLGIIKKIMDINL